MSDKNNPVSTDDPNLIRYERFGNIEIYRHAEKGIGLRKKTGETFFISNDDWEPCSTAGELFNAIQRVWGPR